VTVVQDISQGTEGILATASDEVGSFGRQHRHAANHQDQGEEPGPICHHGGTRRALLDEVYAESAGREHAQGADRLANAKDPVALLAVEGEFGPQRHVGHLEDRIGSVETHDREADPRDQPAAFETARGDPRHHAEAAQQGGGSVEPHAPPTEAMGSTVREGAHERVRHGIPEFRQQEDRADGGGRRPEIVDREFQVHDEDQDVHELRGGGRHPIARECAYGAALGARFAAADVGHCVYVISWGSAQSFALYSLAQRFTSWSRCALRASPSRHRRRRAGRHASGRGSAGRAPGRRRCGSRRSPG